VYASASCNPARSLFATLSSRFRYLKTGLRNWDKTIPWAKCEQWSNILKLKFLTLLANWKLSEILQSNLCGCWWCYTCVVLWAAVLLLLHWWALCQVWQFIKWRQWWRRWHSTQWHSLISYVFSSSRYNTLQLSSLFDCKCWIDRMHFAYNENATPLRPINNSYDFCCFRCMNV